jgi:hypothetical protein
MSILLQTNFSGATNPALTPIPFDSVVEGDANVDVLYGATHGKSSTPGMRVLFNGTPSAKTGYGVVDLTTAARPIPTPGAFNHTRIRFSFNLAAGTYATNDRVTLLQVIYDVSGTDTVLCAVEWVKTATRYKFRLSETLGSTSTTSAEHNKTSYSTYGDWVLDIIHVGGVAHINFSEAPPALTGWINAADSRVIQGQGIAQLAFPVAQNGIAAKRPKKIRIGHCDSLNAVPASVEWRFDDIKIEDDFYPDEGGLAIPNSLGVAPFGRDNAMWGSQPIDMGMFRAEDLISGLRAVTEFGAVAAAAYSGLSIAGFPCSQIPIVPGANYEVLAWFPNGKAAPPDGYTVFTFHAHSNGELTVDVGVYYNMADKYDWCGRALQAQNALLVFNGESAFVEYYIRRIR